MLLGLALAALLFLLGQPLKLGASINAERFAQYGSFIGGILSVWSIYLLVQTLKEQRRNAEESQINSVFWGMLEHLQKEVADLAIYEERLGQASSSGQVEHIQRTNKDYFEALRRMLQQEFQTPPTETSQAERAKQAIQTCLELYVKNPRLGSYFRLLYRICRFVDTSILSEEKKHDYINILRAQLTSSELLHLRYNADLSEGKNFMQLINKYNLVKHLPTFELLEFKVWWEGQDESRRYYLSYFTDMLRGGLKLLLEKHQDRLSSESFGGWSYEAIKSSPTKLQLRLQREVSRGAYALPGGKLPLTPSMLTSLLYEVFCFSNFCLFNTPEELTITSEEDEATGTIICLVESTSPLRLTWQRGAEASEL